MTTPADGDDYTYEVPGGAVLKPNAADGFAELRETFGAEFDRVWPNGLVPVDLRTPDQRERDDVAALNLRCDNLVDALEALAGRVTSLERNLATLVLTLERTFEIRL